MQSSIVPLKNKVQWNFQWNSLESSGKPIQYSRLSKVELDELRNNNYDYYSLFQDEYIQRKLKDEDPKKYEFGRDNDTFRKTTPEEFYQGNKDASDAYRNADNEIRNWRSGNYDYKEGDGWQLKK